VKIKLEVVALAAKEFIKFKLKKDRSHLDEQL